MIGLMYFCTNWGALECQLKDLARMWQSMIRNDLDKLSWPHWNKMEEYDKCCKSCENLFLFVFKNECVICQKGKLEVLLDPGNKRGSVRKYYYSCPKCQTSYYSYEKLI
jgi:hypothetical protein